MSNQNREVKSMSRIIEITDATQVTKANQLIEAHYTLTLWEQKFILMMASQIQPQDLGFETYYKIDIGQLIYGLGLDNRKDAYTRVRQMIDGLVGKKWYIVTTENGKEKVSVTGTWVSSCEYHEGGSFSFEFSERLKPYLVRLAEKFTTYKIKNILPLNSVYSIRLYELMKENEWINHKDFKLDKLKGILLGMEGLEKYKQYAHFHNRIIKSAVKEINEKTDIQIEYFEVKEAKKVVGISFSINKKLVEKSDASNEILNELVAIGVAVEVAKSIVNREWSGLSNEANVFLRPRKEKGFSFDDYVKDKIRLANILHEKGKIKDNKAGWVIKAIANNWVDSAEVEKERKETAKKEALAKQAEKERLEEELNQKRTEEQNKKTQVYLDVFHSLPEQERQSIDKEAKEKFKAQSSFYRDMVLREEKEGNVEIDNMKAGAKSMLLEARFNILVSKYPEKLQKVN